MIWDYREPFTHMNETRPKCPQGHRYLVEGERVKKGDVYHRGGDGSWHETLHPGRKYNPRTDWPMARKKSEADSVGRASTQGAALLSEESVPAPLVVGPVAEEEKKDLGLKEATETQSRNQ